jgi:phosphatidylglycerol:prolipoprotein diacylglycerol transferase
MNRINPESKEGQAMEPLGFVHRIDPVIARLGGVPLYYYGLAYAVGFLGIFAWLMGRRRSLGWSRREVYDLSILFALGVLIVGRAFSIVVYQWDYYRDHLPQLLSYWRGGMASHGCLLGAVLAVIGYCKWRGKDLWAVADELAIPAAFFLGCGRIGNFINGEIYGYETSVWWGVKFPGAEGFRHPVTLYEGLKNFAIVPILLAVGRRSHRGEGKMFAHLVLWYGLLRFLTDLTREYGAEFLGLGRGQYFNLAMAAVGLALLVWRSHVGRSRGTTHSSADNGKAPSQREASPGRGAAWPLYTRQLLLLALVCFTLVIRSGWTEGVRQYLHEQKTAAATPVTEEDSSSRTSGAAAHRRR